MLEAEFKLIYELVSVPNVDSSPKESIKAIKMLNALSNLQTKVNNLVNPDVKRSLLICKNCGGYYGININHKCFKCLHPILGNAL